MEMTHQEIISIIQAHEYGKIIELEQYIGREDWREVLELDTILNMISEGWIARIKK